MSERSRPQASTSSAKSPATLAVFPQAQPTTGAAPKHAGNRLGQWLSGGQNGMFGSLEHHPVLLENEADNSGFSLSWGMETLYNEDAGALLRLRDIPHPSRSARVSGTEEPKKRGPGAPIIRGRHLGVRQYRLFVYADDHRRPV